MFSIQRFFGKEDRFFGLLEASAEEARHSVEALNKILLHETPPSLAEFAELRKKDKLITEDISDLLVTTFVTALEREDIEALANALYKVPKTVEKFVERYLISHGQCRDISFTKHAEMLDEATRIVVEMIKALHVGMDIVKMKALNDKLQKIESDADDMMLDLLRELYSGKYDALKVVIVRDLYELLEKVIDRCRDAGNVCKHIVFKNS